MNMIRDREKKKKSDKDIWLHITIDYTKQLLDGEVDDMIRRHCNMTNTGDALQVSSPP